jgi:hypothetical protein
MKKIILMVLAVLTLGFSSNCFAARAVTTGNGLACHTERWLDDAVDFTTSQDFDSFRSYLNSEKCFMPQSGLTVTVTDYGFGKSEIIFLGERFWILNEGISLR